MSCDPPGEEIKTDDSYPVIDQTETYDNDQTLDGDLLDTSNDLMKIGKECDVTQKNSTEDKETNESGRFDVLHCWG